MDQKIKKEIKGCLAEIKLLTDKKYIKIYCERINRLIDKENEFNSIKNPMHSIDLLSHIFEFEIYESDCPKHRQVTLDHSTDTIWFGDVDIFLTKLKNYLTQFSFTRDAYENVNLEKLIRAVENKYLIKENK